MENKKTILLIEDEAVIAVTQKMLLEKSGYNVITAYTGEKAISDFSDDNDIDLLLVDIDLGKGMDGTQAAELILEKHDIPVVFLSSHNEPETVRKTEKITSYGYILKNNSETVLLTSIKMAFKLFDAHKKSKNELAARIKAEETSKINETRYQSLIDLAVDGILLGNHEGTITEANECMCRILNMARDEVIGKHITQLPFTQESLKKNPLRFDLLQKGETVVSERMLIKPDGTEVTIEMRSKMMPDGSYQSIYRDITERKLAELNLMISEEKFRTLSESSPFAIMMHQGDNWIYANRAATEISGYTKEELYRIHFWDIVHPDYKDIVKESGHARQQGKELPKAYEFKIITKSGIEKWVSLTGNQIEYEKKNTALISVNDITERKRVEEKLRESEKNFRLLFDESPLPTILSEIPSGKISFANKRMLALMGMIPDDVYGKTASELGLIKNSGDLEKVSDLIASHGYVDGLEMGKVFPEIKSGADLIYMRPVTINGKPFCLTVIQDMSERLRAEEEKRFLMERLQQAEKMEALGLLAGGVAHDLNNVLGVIVGYSELLLIDIDNSNPIKPHLTSIMNGGLRASEIVQDMLTLARRGVVSRKVINLNNTIEECRNLPEFKKIYSDHPDIEIQTDLDPHLLNISGSTIHLGKTIFNLTLNASEAITGKGTVIIKTTNQYLDKPIHGYDEIRDGDYIVLTVADSGEGIPESDLKRIFEPFYTKKFMGRSGTGLGLSIVWGTVKDHNGYITVKSERGKGTVFTLYFPVSRDEIENENSKTSISEFMGNGEHILVIDDVKEQRDLCAAMLKKLNYKAETASSGEVAIEYLKNNKADLLVLDMIMDPGMDGLDTYKAILKFLPEQKAIISSGFSESDRVNAAQNLGAGRYVKKPYVIEILGQAVKIELEK